MKRAAAVIMTLLLLCGCAHTVKPRKITETEFPLEEAVELVKMLEAPVLELSSLETVTGKQLLDYGETSGLFRPEEHGSIIRDFLVISPEELFELRPDETYQVCTDLIYPTVFHQDVEVTSAVIRTWIYDKAHSGFDQEKLIVTEEYTGEEPLLKGFERRYLFERDSQGVWQYDSLSGVSVYSFDKDVEIALKNGNL